MKLLTAHSLRKCLCTVLKPAFAITFFLTMVLPVLANYPRTQPLTHYDGQERISGSLDWEYTGQMKGEDLASLSVPNKWTYEYVDSAKQLGVYRFVDVCIHTEPVDGDWPYYIQPVRLLDSKPGFPRTEYWNPFFDTIATCPFEEIVFNASPETVTSDSFIVHATHEVYNSVAPVCVVNLDRNYAMTSGGLFVDVASGGFLHDPDGSRAHYGATTYYYPFIKYVGPYCFASNSVLTEVVVPEGVTHIEEGAFSGCRNLTSVTLPATLEYIGEAAFAGCESLAAFTVSTNNPAFKVVEGVLFSKDGKRLIAFPPGKGGNYTLPADVETIDDHAFDGCTNVVVEIPWVNSLELEWWRPNPFADCAQVRTVVPEGVEYLFGGDDIRYCTHVVLPSTWCAENDVGMPGGFQFQSSEALVALEVVPDNPNFKSVDGVVFSKDGRELALFPTCRGGAYAVPEGVTSIGYGAFAFSDLESVSLPASLQSIEEIGTTFSNMFNLKSISVDIGSTAFASMDGVLFSADYGRLILYPADRDGAAYSVPPLVSCIGEWAFCYCVNLETVYIPHSVERIETWAFDLCLRLEDILVSDVNPSYKDIDGVLLTKDGTNLLYCPEGKTGAYSIPEGVLNIEEGAFFSSSLGSVTIPNGVTNIGVYAFYYCDGLTTITITEGVRRIGYHAFGYCSALTTVTISDGVTDIGPYCFEGCDSLAWLQLPYAFKYLLDDIDLGIPTSCEVVFGDRVPLAAVEVGTPTVMEGLYTDIWLGVAGGAGPYTLSIEGDLPEGMWYYDGYGACQTTSWLTLYGAPGEGASDAYTFTVRVTDAEAEVFEREFTLAVNRRPVIKSVDPTRDFVQVKPRNSFLPFSVTASDPDGDPLAYTWYVTDGEWNPVRKVENETGRFLFKASELTNGVYHVDVHVSDRLGLAADHRWTVNVTPVVIAIDLPHAIDGVTYSVQLTATGGAAPYAWSLPDGEDEDACLSPAGVLSLTPYSPYLDADWTRKVLVQATDVNGTTAMQILEIVVEPILHGSSPDSDWNRVARVGEPLTFSFDVYDPSGMDIRFEWELDWEPVNCDQAEWTWTPTRSDIGLHDLSLYAWDDSPDGCWGGCRSWLFRVVSTNVLSGDVALPAAVVGEPYSASFSVSGGTEPYAWTYPISVAFAPGVSLSADGTVSGTPTQAGIYQVPVTATDAEGATWSGTAELVVLPESDYIDVDGVVFTTDWRTLVFFPRERGGTYAVPAGTVEIATNAFRNCSTLARVEIPASVTSIGENAFDGCRNLARIEIDADNSVYRSIGGVVFSKNRRTLIRAPEGWYGNMVLTENVREIAPGAFADCWRMLSVEVQPTVSEIEPGAFVGCVGLKSMTLPFVGVARGTPETGFAFGSIFGAVPAEGTVAVRQHNDTGDDSATGNYYIPTNLVSVTITDETEVSQYAFENCAMLKGIQINAGATNIGARAFCGSGVTNLAVSAAVTSIGDKAFFDCHDLARIEIDADNPVYRSIGGIVFTKNRRTLLRAPAGWYGSAVLTENVREIAPGAFEGCWRLLGVSVPGTVSAIAERTFDGCAALRDVTLSEGVAAIGNGAFSGCSAIAELALPASVEWIGTNAFAGCTGLVSVTMNGDAIPEDAEHIGANAFADVPAAMVVLVQSGATGWGETWQGFEVRVIAAATGTTPTPVPLAWLDDEAATILVANDGDYETTANATAANGVNKVWECYVAGISPTDAAAAFRTVISFENGVPVVGWEPKLTAEEEAKRVYTVEGKANLADAWAPTNSASRFFRAKVEMP